jgi:hypothetical protein
MFTCAVMYVHLGGSPVAPLGIFLAAVFTRDWKGLLKVGTICALVASPMLLHFFRYIDWYNGQRGHVAGSFATLTYLLAIPGLFLLLKRPKDHLFLLIWAVAPVAWFFQDNLRFFLQSTIVASTIAGLFLTWLLRLFSSGRIQVVLTATVVLLATIFPLSIPSLPVELAWATGNGFPRELDWNEARTLARVMDEAHLGDRIVNSYYDSLSAAMAVYSPLSQEFGHWGEVRPPSNPAEDISAGDKLYVLPLPPNDSTLQQLAGKGWVTVHGGSPRTSLISLPTAGPPEEVIPLVTWIIRQESRWLAEHTVNNRMPPPENLFHPKAIGEFRRITTIQRNHAGRITTAILVWAFALEESDPETARLLRRTSRGWGSMANFLGDETALDYLSEAQYDLFRDNVGRWGKALANLTAGTPPTEEVSRLTRKLMDDFFG